MRVWTAWERCRSSLLFQVMSDCLATTPETGKITMNLIFLRDEIWLLVFQ